MKTQKKRQTVQSQPTALVRSAEPFEQWWLKYSRKRNLSPALKFPLAAHMKARGFWKSMDWDAGARDFGWR